MSAEARPRFLDITRLVARAGAGPLTGIDRVERAYLAALIDRGDPFALICRTAFGFLIVAPEAAPRLLGWVDDPDTIPSPPLFARAFGRARGGPGLEAALRHLARARLRLGGLTKWLAGAAPAGATYLNVGHANLSWEFLAGLRLVPGLTIAVMIHDTIPLDRPEFSGGRAPAEFRRKLSAVAGHADLVLCPSRAVQADVARWCGQFGRVPPTQVAPLGVVVAKADPGAIPRGLDLARPYFVTLGTIEPRKDHALLLDVWAGFHAALPETRIPHLLILGRRGWANADVFQRLDHDSFIGRAVFELPGLPDGAVAALVQGSCGLLAPSRAEGFGLPVAEAAAMGVPVLACDLSVTREILGSYPIYAPAGDRYTWAKTIGTMAQQAHTQTRTRNPANVPAWTDHFSLVFTRI